MHIVVFGVGAIGGFYGTMLSKYINAAQASWRLSFVARGKTYQALKNFGSKLICQKQTLGEMQETITLEPKLNVYEHYQDLSIDPNEYTLVLLCVKSKDTIAACEDIKRNFSDKTLVVSVQNGVENEERIAAVLGHKNTLGALTNVAAETLEPGIYMQKGSYGLLIGELPGNENMRWQDRARIDVVFDVLNSAGINVRISRNIYKDLWSKLVWNAAFNPASVYYERTTGKLLADPVCRQEIIGIMAEVKKVAQACGYALDPDVDTKHLERTDVPEWYDFRTSMLQDYQQGKSIEIEELLGVVVRKADEHKIAVPYARDLYQKLKDKL